MQNNISLINQLDGNVSLCESTTSSSSWIEDARIPVLISQELAPPTSNTPTPAWHDTYIPASHSKDRFIKTLKRDNKFSKISDLPVISVPNMRSIFPKLNNFIEDFRMRDISVVLCSETWHKEDKKKHKNDVERLLHMEGLKFLSNPRPPGKRGGGCAVIADLTKYSLERLDIPNTNRLEICWGILRPRNAQKCTIKEYILASFYCPPNSKKKEKLISHIITNTHILLSKYPKCGLFIGGDKNTLNIASILHGLPKFRQIVTGNTYKDKCLDILITNLQTFYQPSQIVPAVQPDDPLTAFPSDHSVPVLYPISGISGSVPRTYKTKITRPMPESALRDFGLWLANEAWHGMHEGGDPDGLLNHFNTLIAS